MCQFMLAVMFTTHQEKVQELLTLKCFHTLKIVLSYDLGVFLKIEENIDLKLCIVAVESVAKLSFFHIKERKWVQQMKIVIL